MTYKLKDVTLELAPDGFADNPRDNDCNLATLATWHNRYRLGDVQPDGLPCQYLHEEDAHRTWAACLPLHLYDHSGLHLSTRNFYGRVPQGHADFDSAQVGYAFITKERARFEYGWKYITKKRIALLESYIEAEVKTYAQYLAGDVWGFTVTDNETGEQLDSCWGFYGSDMFENGMADNLTTDQQAELKTLV